MVNNKTDRRVKYTRMILRQSLIELLEEYPLNKITVKDLCSHADINRGTFYTHYTDTYDLFHKIEEELFEQIQNTLIKHRTNTKQPFTVAPAIFTDVFHCIKENIDICRVLLGEHGDAEFLRRVLIIGFEQYLNGWGNDTDDKNSSLLNYLYSYIANGVVGLIQQWISNGMKESADEISMIAVQLTSYGLQPFLAQYSTVK